MAVEAVEGTSVVDQGLAAEGDEVDTSLSAGARVVESAEERLAEAVLQLIQRNGKVQSAIMDLVLSSPYI